MTHVVASVATLVTIALPTFAVAVDLPATPSSAPAASAPPAPAPEAVGASAITTTPVAVTLRMGSGGATVRDLQRELIRRGQRVKVDGSFGLATKKAVKRVQKRMGLSATGVADAAFLGRLGIRLRAIAAVAPVASVRLGAQYLRTFPVVGQYDYTDTYGAARSQGSHEGTDVMSARNTPLVAVADGVVKRMSPTESGLGGISIWLLDTAGNEFYYAHMESIAADLHEGSRVGVGQVIGAVGNSGDARSTGTHLHFEIHPGGGGATNPYAELVAVDPKRAPAPG